MHKMANVLENPLIRRLVALELERDDFVIFGSGPLLTHGIRRSVRDLDVVARGTAWRRVSELGVPAVGAISGDQTVHFWGGRIQFSQEWISKVWDTDDLIDRAEIIEGLRFAQLTDVLAYKQMLMRPKDLADIQALTELLDDQAKNTQQGTLQSKPMSAA
ncbi:MAG: transcriptional regulator, AraC family [Actinomycetia bacterium]|nr:transcriptional regulator, AraC family [Actinomycetes bacterium]